MNINIKCKKTNFLSGKELGKTNVLSKVPLMPISEEIITKYQAKEYYKKTGYIIPVPSNQKVNAYLKEIADLGEITKNLTFHVARHYQDHNWLKIIKLATGSSLIGND